MPAADPAARTCCAPASSGAAAAGAGGAPAPGHALHAALARAQDAPPVLVPLAGGTFLMGAEDGPHPGDGEGPVRAVTLSPFAMAQTAVTVAEFARFVCATGHVTRAEGRGSSWVFHAHLADPAAHPAPPHTPWWREVAGAHWAAPDGPGGPAPRPDHPVTHIAQEDALAYCRWSGTRLPTEAEWEYAARGGLVQQPYPWGADLAPGGRHRSNTWQGRFPDCDEGTDGWRGTAPVRSYAPNGWGLWNMTGNVWERVADRFAAHHSPRPVTDPAGPLNGAALVARGGSYLCHASYCTRYRTSSRLALAGDVTTGHIGFRVAAQAPRAA